MTSYDPEGLDKVMRMNSVTSTIENGFVYLPEKAEWLASYIHELTTFPNGKHDDQTDSTSQALDWAKQNLAEHPFIAWLRHDHERRQAQEQARRFEGPNFRNCQIPGIRWR